MRYDAVYMGTMYQLFEAACCHVSHNRNLHQPRR